MPWVGKITVKKADGSPVVTSSPADIGVEEDSKICIILKNYCQLG